MDASHDDRDALRVGDFGHLGQGQTATRVTRCKEIRHGGRLVGDLRFHLLGQAGDDVADLNEKRARR